TATGTVSWTGFGTGLPQVEVLDLQLQTYGTTPYLLAGTHGLGAWRIDATPPAPAAPRPGVGGLSPSQGPTTGGTMVTITGSAFTGATDVYFGDLPALSFTAESDTQIVAFSPGTST